jgi:hypothetical protein
MRMMQETGQIKTQKMKLTWTFRFLIITPLIMIVTILLAGAGHGTNIPMLICYPILFLIEKLRQGDVLTWTVMLTQFPVYGLIIDTMRKHWIKGIVIALITIAHAGQIKVALDKRTKDQSTTMYIGHASVSCKFSHWQMPSSEKNRVTKRHNPNLVLLNFPLPFVLALPV